MADQPNISPSTLAEQLAEWIRLRKTKDLLDAIPDPKLRQRVEEIAKKAVSPSIITRAVATAERGLTTLDNTAGQSSRPVVLATLLGLAGFGSWMLPSMSHPATANATRPVESPGVPPTLASIKYDPQAGKQQYLLGLYSRVFVVPPPNQAVTINGNLNDWNEVGKFSTRLRSTSARHSVSGMMMADDDNLYIGAHIADPFPMQGKVSFAADAKADPLAFKGGALQVRLNIGGGQSNDVNSDEIVHLDIWHFAAAAAGDNGARLRIAHGMDYHDPHNFDQKDAPFKGQFSLDEDRRGYVVEYAIPWKLLSTASTTIQKPSGNCALTWNVFWSNDVGDDWRIKLVEVFNDVDPPNEGVGRSTYSDLTTWGIAKF